jgi:hypothetical protein
VGLAAMARLSPTYQLDRGRFENALAERCTGKGVVVSGGAFVER